MTQIGGWSGGEPARELRSLGNRLDALPNSILRWSSCGNALLIDSND
jgi:hypothetical protein